MNSAAPARPLAIVSGGSRGLGFETARGLAARGYDLALIAKDAARLTSARDQLLAEYSPAHPGLSITTHSADLENQASARKVGEELIAALPTALVMVLAHGVMSEKMSKTLRTTDAEWNRVMAINLDSVFTLINVIAPAMADARNGRVVIYLSLIHI